MEKLESSHTAGKSGVAIVEKMSGRILKGEAELPFDPAILLLRYLNVHQMMSGKTCY